MYQVSVEQHFDAAHYLRDYHGKCENLHGHRFKVVVNITANKLNKIGLAYDFVDIKQRLEGVLATFDHTCLNDVPPFDKINPSSENIAVTIFEELKQQFNNDVVLSSIEVWESPQGHITYSP